VRRIVVKLGGSVITKKHEGVREVDQKVLDILSSEISRALKESALQVLIVHGAGPYGHVPAKKYGLAEGFKSVDQIPGIVETRLGMEELNRIVVSSLANAGVNAVAFQPSAAIMLDDGRINDFDVSIVRKMLELRLVPVGYGDVLTDVRTGFKILSGDQLTAYLAKMIGADLVVMVGDYDGVFEGEPGESEQIKELTRGNIDSFEFGAGKGADVTGGFKRKLEELLELADAGIATRIVSGREKDFLYDSLVVRKEHGTLVKK